MASKKLGCPISSIFQQWTAQHQRQQVDIENQPSPSPPSYRVLLQTSYSLKSRITAAEPVENPHLYKRAGLATPPERAIRDIHGASDTAWLLRLVELAVHQQQRQRQKQKGSDGDVSTTETGSIIFLTTKARPQDYSIVQELPQDIRRNVQVIDIGSRDPFGWEEKENDTDDGKATTFANINNLGQLYQRLKEEFDRASTCGTPVILIWQSLTPLIMVHGFKKVLRLLCALPTCLQVWPVKLQVMTPKQHAQLEDASNAILYLRGGEMNIIRQGIRERGNVLRQKLPFRLEAIVNDTHEQRRFRIVEEAEDEEGRNNDDDDHHSSKAASSSDKDGNGNNAIAVDKTGTIESSHIDGRSRGAHLQIEENDGGRNERVGGNFSSENEVAGPHRPRIYLEDDDPEFDDFDEEDPDDDLDI
jgi:hypothetical protein